MAQIASDRSMGRSPDRDHRTDLICVKMNDLLEEIPTIKSTDGILTVAYG